MTNDFFADAYKALLSTIKNNGNCLEIAISFSQKTKEELADFLEVDKSTISRMLTGNSAISSDQVANICDFLGNNLLGDYVVFNILHKRMAKPKNKLSK